MYSDIEKTNSLNYSLFIFRNNILIFRYIFRFRHLNLNKNKHPLREVNIFYFNEIYTGSALREVNIF